MPLSLVVVGANRNDISQLAAVLEGKVVHQIVDEEQEAVVENLCADAGYVSKAGEALMNQHGYVPHIRPRGEERALIERNPDFRAHRWVVEVSHNWYNQFRKLTIRYEKKVKNWIALHNLAAAVIALRKITLPDGTNLIYG